MRIKSKWFNPGEKTPFLHFGVVAIEKGDLWAPFKYGQITYYVYNLQLF